MEEQAVEIINWSEMPDKDKVRLLLDKVMGYFVLEETVNGEPDLSKYAQSPSGFHWPIAYWGGDMLNCWQIRDIATHPTWFNPLHDLNDAWKLMQKADGMSVTVSYSPYAQTDTIRMAYHTCEITCWTPNTSKTYRACAETAQEALCIAFLRRTGIQVINVLKDHLRWAKDSRKVKLEEIKVPEDYFNGSIEWA